MNNRIVNRYVAMLMAVLFTLATVFASSTMNVSAATKLRITPSAKTIAVKSSATLKANKSVKWSVVKGTKVVKLVDKKSKSVTVKGLKAGIATVKAKAGKKYVTTKITVKKNGSVTTGAEISGTVVAKIDLSKGAYKDGKVTKIWAPIPESDNYQTISDVKCEAPDAKVAKTTKDSAGNTVYYIEFDESVPAEKRTGEISYKVTRKEIKSTDMVEIGTVNKNEMAKYLGEFETSGSLTSGVVKETADKIVKDAKAKTVLQKARAIFDWEVQNLYRRETAVDDLKFSGCGRGEVQMVLETTKGGKCTDLNSTYVALLRSQGIPAREKFGMRINAGKSGVLKAPEHCRAEFYLPGTGWVEADPADTLKALLKDGISFESGKVGREARASEERWNALYAQYWGANDNNWVKLASGRDITLDPKQEAKCPEGKDWERCVLNKSGTLNNMGYIYGETDGKYMNAYDAAAFGYTYEFVATN